MMESVNVVKALDTDSFDRLGQRQFSLAALCMRQAHVHEKMMCVLSRGERVAL